ncbi:ATP-binding protein [Ramlibacter sp. AN1015]|uniref:hybrid sensor histidine kinase/response regulator n=1 Tax=Ramlibacter sp. AN1015 TaxID=3133428 RepID=UPI0030C2378A
MTLPPVPQNEEERLQRLMRLHVLDTQAEAVLDAFTALATSATGLPISAISLVDGRREWWKSAVGLPQGGELPRDISFCAHAIGAPGLLMEVGDARQDPRFRDNPLVLNGLVVHYASCVLEMPQGERVGTLFVVGREPGQLGEPARALLVGLAQAVVQVLLLREQQQEFDALLRSQALLQEREERFRVIANGLPQMVWSAGPDGLVDFYNARWHEFVGTAEGSGLGEEWKAPVHPEDRRMLVERWLASIEHGAPFEAECRLRHCEGEYRWVLARALPVHNGSATVQRWLGTCTDIDRQKQLEERLRNADQRKDEFLAMLAHELRSPLAPIATAAHTLTLVPEQADRVCQSAELITRQVRHMGALLKDLLDVSRVTRGTISLEHQLVDLNSVVHEALEQVWPTMDEHGHRVALHLDARAVLVQGDRTRLIQVLVNLLNNAARYTPSDGLITIAVEVPPSHRQPPQQKQMAVLRVSDTGSGIEPELLPRVFDLFAQGARTADRREGGLGLGLALVKSLVELHGGSVQARSEGPGRGSEFQVMLPLAQAGAAAGGSSRKQPHRARRSLRVMVVDDNLDAARSLGAWFEAQGHSVVVETDPLRALERNAQQPAQIYVLDIGLPGMDGYELARRLRSQPGSHDATLVALTGYGQPQDVAQAQQAGFDHHIVKPLDPEQMAQVLARAEHGA